MVKPLTLQARIHVSVAVLHRKPLPSVGLVALGRVLRDGGHGAAFDGEAVAVRERDEPTKVEVLSIGEDSDRLLEAELPGLGARLVGEAFLQACMNVYGLRR